MRNYRQLLIGLVTMSIAAAAGSPAFAGTSFDFLFSMSNVSNDRQFYLNLAVHDSGVPRTVLEPALPRVRYVEEDLPVILFIARHSDRSINFIVDLREHGYGWSVVFNKCRVPKDVLFVGIDQDPGPPYGRAWGYWKKNPKRVRLTDREVCGLVDLQLGHRIVGVTPVELAHSCSGGRPIYEAVAMKKGRSYRNGPGKAGVPPGHGGVPPGHGGVPPGHAKDDDSHGKGKGHSENH